MKTNTCKMIISLALACTVAISMFTGCKTSPATQQARQEEHAKKLEQERVAEQEKRITAREKRMVKQEERIDAAKKRAAAQMQAEEEKREKVVPITPATPADVPPAEAQEIAMDAYVYGYPLIMAETSRRVISNVREPVDMRAPMGQIAMMRMFLDASNCDVMVPNDSTLYSVCWIDVGEEPWILSLPDAKGRYYSWSLMDGWTDVFQAPGTRTTGDGPQTYAITGPGWRGELPDGVTEYKSPTDIVLMLGRIYCTGTKEDYAAAHQMQNGVSIVPLSAYGEQYTNPPGDVNPQIIMTNSVRDLVKAIKIADYFNALAMLMQNNPPSDADAPIVAEMAKIGLVPGQQFDITRLNFDAQVALQDVPEAAYDKIMEWYPRSVAAGFNKENNGWLYALKTGDYGTNYFQRAFMAAIGFGCGRPEDSLTPASKVDANGQPYDGSKKYVIHFDKDQLPPVNGFWSLTMYNDQYYFVTNSLNRYSIGEGDPLKANDDGSVDLYIQHDPPGKEKESNWLPAPEGRFVLMFRFYWPKDTQPSLLDGSWTIPAVARVD